MTDENIDNESMGSAVLNPVISPEQAGAITEKMLPQSEVDRIVKSTKYSMAEKAKRDVEEARRQAFEQIQSQKDNSASNVAPVNQADFQTNFNNAFANFAEKLQAQKLEQEAQEIANQFFSKLAEGKKNYDDFEEAFEGVDFKAISNTVQLANKLDNTADVMYELAKNPRKMIDFEIMADRMRGKAESELKKLSLSIKQNKEGAQAKQAPDPVRQISHSVSKGTNGSLSVDDFSSYLKSKGMIK